MTSDEHEIDDGVDALSNRAGQRSTSSKIANLKAAFEKDGLASPPKRKFPTLDRRTSERNLSRVEELQSELARLKHELDHERELRHVFEEKCSLSEEKLVDLRRQASPAQIDEEPEREPEPTQEMNTVVAERDQAMEELRVAQQKMEQLSKQVQSHIADQSKLQQLLEENNALASQVTELKKDISASTRMSNQVSDSVLAQEMNTLHHEIQNWVVAHFRRLKSDMTVDELCRRLDTIAERRHHTWLKSMYQTWDPAAKMAFYQSTALCYIMEIFNDPLIYGLPTQQDWRKALRKLVEALPDVLEPATFQQWRATTFDALRNSPSMAPSVQSAAEGIAEIICITLGALTESDDQDARRTSLVVIVRRAITLAHTIRVQRSPYEFLLPQPGAAFDPLTMQDMASGDEPETSSSKTVKCSTSPTLMKRADDEGNPLHEQAIIVKAQVLCEAPASGG